MFIITATEVAERNAMGVSFVRAKPEGKVLDVVRSTNKFSRSGSWVAASIFAAVFLLIATVAAAQDKPAGNIRIDRAASHSMVPGAKVGDGYLTITNTGSEPDRLIGARSERAKTVQLHQMSMDNGIMTMRELKGGLTIPAGETIRLEPNYHLMFQDIAKPFKQGETVKTVLVFEKAGDVEADFVVGKIAGPLDDVGAAMHGGHEGHAQ
ncbi:copper chaperone PCu(A)C [Rhizobium sp. P38BS-XIX]|uniref:copper chaperone PCu(A)C n=1 Tax=Rhizobium sp. P38BS-XIX TaxID=2726740 RepID=UPI001FEE8A91|nr:copper chaperone PCu(A)C [Rhizobium sp. P38BS-XIX]